MSILRYDAPQGAMRQDQNGGYVRYEEYLKVMGVLRRAVDEKRITEEAKVFTCEHEWKVDWAPNMTRKTCEVCGYSETEYARD